MKNCTLWQNGSEGEEFRIRILQIKTESGTAGVERHLGLEDDEIHEDVADGRHRVLRVHHLKLGVI